MLKQVQHNQYFSFIMLPYFYLKTHKNIYILSTFFQHNLSTLFHHKILYYLIIL